MVGSRPSSGAGSWGRTNKRGIGSDRTNSSATLPSQRRVHGPAPITVITTRSTRVVIACR